METTEVTGTIIRHDRVGSTALARDPLGVIESALCAAHRSAVVGRIR